MQIQQLEIFVRIFKTKSLTKTAQQIYLSQPRVSQQLKSMEAELGVALFDRTNHKVVPTRAGQLLYPYAVNMLNFYSEALDMLAAESNDFYIHRPTRYSTSPMDFAMQDFAAACPEASFKQLPPTGYSEFDSAESLTPRHLYLVRQEWIEGKGIKFFDLGEAIYTCILKSGDPLAKNKFIRPEELKSRTLYLPTFYGTKASVPGPYVWYLRNYFAENYPDTDIRNERNLSMIVAKVLSVKGAVGLYANNPYHSSNLSLELRILKMENASHIGFAYVGQATDHMMKYMEMAAARMEQQRQRLEAMGNMEA